MPPVQVLLKALVYLCVAVGVAVSAASSPGVLLSPSAGTWVARRTPPAPPTAAFAPLAAAPAPKGQQRLTTPAMCVPPGAAGGVALAGATLGASLGASFPTPSFTSPPPHHRLPPPSFGLLSAVAGGSGAEGSADAGAARGTPKRLFPPNGSLLYNGSMNSSPSSSPAAPTHAALPARTISLPPFLENGISCDGLAASADNAAGQNDDSMGPSSPSSSPAP